MSQAPHASSAPPPAEQAAPCWDDWGEPWTAPADTFRLCTEDGPEEWARQLKRDSFLLLREEHAALARAGVHLLIEQMRPASGAKGRGAMEVRTFRHMVDREEDEETLPEESRTVAKATYQSNDGLASPIATAGQTANTTSEWGESFERPVETGTPKLDLQLLSTPNLGADSQSESDAPSEGGGRPRLVPLAELICWSRPPGAGRLVVIVDLLAADQVGHFQRFFDDAPTYGELRSRLQGLKVQLVVLVGSAFAHGQVDLLDRKRRRAELKRELAERQKLLISHQAAMQARARQGLIPLLTAVFSSHEAKSFVQAHFSDDLANRINWSADHASVIAEVVEALLRHGEVERLPPWLEKARPKQTDTIRAVFASLGGEWADLLLSIQDVTHRLSQVPQEQEEPRVRTLDVPVCGADATPMNLVDRLIERRVHTRHLTRTLRTQIDLRWWGDTVAEAISRLLDFSDAVSLEEEIHRLETNQYIEPKMLQRYGIVSKVVIFLACFFESLPPREFSAVVEFLLHLEIAAGAQSAGPTREADEGDWELRSWRADADQIMGECGLHVVRALADDSGPRVKWRSPMDGLRWRAYLSSRCHMFVERQLLHLQRSSVLFVAARAGSELFELLRPALVKQASLNPNVLARQWLDHYVNELEKPKATTATDVDAVSALAALLKEGLSEAERMRRLGGILKEMQLHRNLRGEVVRFFQRIIQTAGPGRARCVAILRELRGAPDFDDIGWLINLYRSGGEEARQGVVDLWIRYGRTTGEGLSTLMSDTLRSRVPEEPFPLDTPTDAVLALDVTLVLAGNRGNTLAPVPLDQHPLTQPLTKARAEGASLPWILRTLSRPEAIERALSLGFEWLPGLVTAAMTPRHGPAARRVEIASALAGRWGNEMSVRMGDHFAWYTRNHWPALRGLYAGQVLVDWMLSVPTGETGTVDPLEPVLLDHLSESARTLPRDQHYVWRVHWQSLFRALQDSRVILEGIPQLTRADREAIYADLCARRDSIQRLYLRCGAVAPPTRSSDHGD